MAAQSVRSRLNICRQCCAKCGLFTSCSPLHILRRTPTYATASRINIFSRGMFVCQALGTKIPDSEWKKILTSEQFWVCRQKGTEPPWSGKFVDHKKKGIYQCVCCGVDLFSSDTKFDSGTGWPSFYDAIHEETSGDGQPPVLSVSQKHDNSHGMIRVEVLCKKCDSHLGHVFQDGPSPTGLRYCINSLSLKFQQAQANSES